MAALPPKPAAAADDDDEMFEGGELDDEEDDEETLQLKLQAIQARLKLKKLKAAKALKRNSGTQEPSPGSGDGGGGGIPLQSKLAVVRDRLDKQQQQQSRNSIEVPASPTRRPQSMTDLQTSPRRVLLGIDKGLRGADVSLKRAPIQRSGTESRLGQQQGGVLQRAKSPLDAPQRETKRPLSFNERLASARTEEIARREKRERAQNARTTAFSVGKQEMEEYKTKAQDLPELPSKPQEFSRDQILSSMGKPTVPQLQRSRTLSDLRSGTTTTAPTTNITNTSSSFSAATNGDSGAAFEPYSGLHLSKRILPHNVLARAVSGKKSYLLKDLLRQVKAPDWCLPDEETDIVVFAIVASKSDPRDHRPGPGGNGKAQQDRGKYMVITLVDLTYEVDLFLFNTGFDRFWKLTPGTVVAILNPNILPPVPGREATNRFGLTINSDADTILEIGSARDLGYCKSIKKDGTYCKSWVNSRRTEYCEYHTNEAVRKARSSRVELSSTAGFGGGDGPRGRANSRRVFAKSSEEDRQRSNYDRATQSQYFISTAHRSTDPDDERLTGIADRKEREEHLKRRLAQKEKERDIARRLGEMGGGAGRDYMTRAASRASGTTSRAGPGSSFSSVTTSFSSAPPPASSATTSATSFGSTAPTPPGMKPDLLNDPTNMHQPRKWDARALGLIGRRGSDQPKVSLAPPPKPTPASSANGTTTGSTAAKRKRPESSGSSFSSNSAAQQQQQQQNGPSGGRAVLSLGWGSNLRDKLGRMKEGERLDGRKVMAMGGDGDGDGDVPMQDAGAASATHTDLVGPDTNTHNSNTNTIMNAGADAATEQLGLPRRGSATATATATAIATRRGDTSPVRKKTRFVTDRGIKEAGRESLGETLSMSAAAAAAAKVREVRAGSRAGSRLGSRFGAGVGAGAGAGVRRRVVVVDQTGGDEDDLVVLE